MPRVTRAALRSQELQEESDVAASVPLPMTPIKARVPLGETSGNTVAMPEIVNEENMAAAAKKGPGKGKKGNAARKATKPKKAKAEKSEVEVLEDDNRSQTSSAAEEACKDLLREDSALESNTVAIEEERPHTPPSSAVKEAVAHLSSNPTTPNFNPEIHKSGDTGIPNNEISKDDSFVANIKSRTPVKMTDAEGLGISMGDDVEEEDSFVEQIKSRTPGKRISRIEDSVEALDVLEEEIEKVGGLIPDTAEVQSPVKTKKETMTPSNATDRKWNGSLKMKNNTPAPAKTEMKKPSTNVRPVPSRPSMQATSAKRSGPPIGSIANQKRDVAAKKIAGTSPTSTRKAQSAPKKRISSVHKAPFQPTKSAKPPTRAAFELPGDAISRKLKEQREERLKRDEEEKSKQRVFKARPVRLSQAPEVKLTAATKARLSMAKGESVVTTKPTTNVTRAKPMVHTGSMAPVDPHKRLSSLTVAKRTTTPPSANSSARVTRAPSLSTSNITRNPSATGAPRPAPTAEDVANQKVKGKEVFGRTRIEIQEREKARKEKDQAVKKARAEAAERGRIASREWAEKQKLRKLEARKANDQAKVVEA